jgi:RNA polymerase sigma factor (sigma-70 family)
MLHGMSMERETSDVELLRRARSDTDAFRAFYQRYALPLTVWMERQVGQREVALDLTAETFACALAGLDRYRAETGETAAPWLYGIAANLLRRYWGEQIIETRYREQLGVLEQTRFSGDLAPDAIERLDAGAAAQRLRTALDALPDAYRGAVELRVVGGLSYSEVADQMASSDTTARVRVHRGLRALRLAIRRREEL